MVAREREFCTQNRSKNHEKEEEEKENS